VTYNMAEQVLTELPDGIDESEVVKPVKLAKELDIRPQIVYGWIRNSGLPAHTKDGEGRFIVRSEFAEWQVQKEEKKAEREKKKAEKAEKDAAKAAAKEAGTDEESGDAPASEEDYE